MSYTPPDQSPTPKSIIDLLASVAASNAPDRIAKAVELIKQLTELQRSEPNGLHNPNVDFGFGNVVRLGKGKTGEITIPASLSVSITGETDSCMIAQARGGHNYHGRFWITLGPNSTLIVFADKCMGCITVSVDAMCSGSRIIMFLTDASNINLCDANKRPLRISGNGQLRLIEYPIEMDRRRAMPLAAASEPVAAKPVAFDPIALLIAARKSGCMDCIHNNPCPQHGGCQVTGTYVGLDKVWK